MKTTMQLGDEYDLVINENTPKVAVNFINNGGYIDDAGDGKKWTSYRSGKEIKNSKNMRYLVGVRGYAVATSNYTHGIIRLHKAGKIDIHALGMDTCSKCCGEGKLFQYAGVHGGVCYKCNGFGYIQSK